MYTKIHLKIETNQSKFNKNKTKYLNQWIRCGYKTLGTLFTPFLTKTNYESNEGTNESLDKDDNNHKDVLEITCTS